MIRIVILFPQRYRAGFVDDGEERAHFIEEDVIDGCISSVRVELRETILEIRVLCRGVVSGDRGIEPSCLAEDVPWSKRGIKCVGGEGNIGKSAL